MSASAGTGRSGARRRRAAARRARPGVRAPSISAARVSQLGERQFSELKMFPCLSCEPSIKDFTDAMEGLGSVSGSVFGTGPPRLSRVCNKCWKVHGAP